MDTEKSMGQEVKEGCEMMQGADGIGHHIKAVVDDKPGVHTMGRDGQATGIPKDIEGAISLPTFINLSCQPWTLAAQGWSRWDE